MPIPEIIDTNKLEDFSVDRHKRRLDAYNSSTKSGRQVTAFDVIRLTTFSSLMIAAVYCTLYLIGTYSL